jgi:hypothetical protein
VQKNKIKRLSQFHLKLIAIIGLVLIVSLPMAFYAAGKILNPVKILVEPSLEYDFLYPIDEDLFIAEIFYDHINKKCGIVNKRGEIILPVIYDYIDYCIEDFDPYYVKNGLIRAVKDNKYGIFDKTGKTIVPFIYDYIGEFHEEIANISQDGKWGYIDSNGNIAIDLIYDFAFDFSEGLAMAKLNYKLGFIYKTGEIVIPFVYDGWICESEFKNGLMAMGKIHAENTFGFGVIDKTGNVVIPFEYSWIRYKCYTDEIYFEAGKIENETIFFDTNGEMIMEIDNEDYTNTGILSEGLLAVQKDEKWGYLNMEGEIAVPIIYSYAENFKDGLAVAGMEIGVEIRRKNRAGSGIKVKYGMIDKTGKEIIPFEYDRILNDNNFKFGEAVFVGKFIPDSNGEMIRKFGYINRPGEEIIPLIYENPFRFEYGLAIVKKGGKCGIINQNGDLVVEFIYDSINIIDDGILMAKKDGKWGIIDSKGNIVLDCGYEQITKRRKGKFLGIQKDGLWGILELKTN